MIYIKNISFGLILAQIIFFACSNNQIRTNTNRQVDTSEISNLEPIDYKIWQLDYYPDSIFITKDINFDHIWESSYAYCIEFSEDSCQFIGWHESWWERLKKIKPGEYKTINDSEDFRELKFTSDGKLFMRGVIKRKEGAEISKYYPYHQVNKILTQDSLQHKIAKEIFAGEYKLLYNDTLKCDDKIVLNENFEVHGIDGITNYGIETEIDWDFAVDNAFWLTSPKKDSQKCFSFKFSGDTLFLKGYKISENQNGDYSEITNTRIKLVKIK